MFTLDTNILIEYLDGDTKVVNQLTRWREKDVSLFISVITEIEVLAFPKLTREEQKVIHSFLAEFISIPVDSQLGRRTASFRRESDISLGDAVITSTAYITNSKLVTRDKQLQKSASKYIEVVDI